MAPASSRLLFAFGVWTWWKGGRRSLLVLLLTPFALNLLAAAMRIYPMASPRLSQHLRPPFASWPGQASPQSWNASSRRMLSGCGDFGVSRRAGILRRGGLVLDVVRPYRDRKRAG